MYKRILRKRILKGLTIALALFAVIPVMNAAAKPVSLVNKVDRSSQAQQADPWFQTLVANQKYQNQYRPTGPELQAMIARGEGMNKKYNLGQYAFGVTGPELQAMIARGEGMNKKYNLGQYKVSTEISTGLQGPSQPQTVASTGSDFEWGNAGIGAGIAAVLIAGTAAALAVRSRRHGGFAH